MVYLKVHYREVVDLALEALACQEEVDEMVVEASNGHQEEEDVLA